MHRFRLSACALLTTALLLSMLVSASTARAADFDDPDAPAEARKAPAVTSQDDYSFNWLDPDKKIYVLQNRRYRKSGHVLLSLMGGVSFSNPYRSVLNIDPRIAFYLSENFGIEGFFTLSTSKENAIFNALVAATGNVLPVIRDIKSQAGGLVHWAPWYSKINVFNSIIYFDWYFVAGLGMTSSDVNYTRSTTGALTRENDLTFFWGTGHLFHISDMFKFRFEFTASHFKAPIFATGTSGDEAWQNNYNVGIGLGVRL